MGFKARRRQPDIFRRHKELLDFGFEEWFRCQPRLLDDFRRALRHPWLLDDFRRALRHLYDVGVVTGYGAARLDPEEP